MFCRNIYIIIRTNIVPKVNKNIMDKFRKFLKSKLTAEVYEELHTKLDTTSNPMTKNRLTLIKNSPNRANLDDVLNLASLLNVPAYTLVMDYGMGKDDITLSQMDNLPELQEGVVKLPKSA